MTSKEYLTNDYILLKYFELVFFSATYGKNFMQIDHHLIEL